MKKQLADLATNLAATTVLTGSWTADNDTRNGSIPTTGTWTFTRTVPIQELDIVHGCFRPVAFPWYLQPFPWWNAFFTVPIFSVLSSLMNMQPYWSFQLFVMVFISCLAFAANIAANHFIFNRSDVVSAIGAFVVGILGNIYSRKFSGTAFTSMVTGVLFLVPVRAFCFLVWSWAVLTMKGRSLDFLSQEESQLWGMELRLEVR